MVNRRLSRRVFLRSTVAILGAATLTPVLSACGTDQPTPRGYDQPTRPLPIPPLAEGTLDGMVRRFELTAQTGTSEVLPGIQTTTWGFNGAYLGPTLRMRNGEDVTVTIRNELDELTTVHWHGMKLPAWADGGPHSPIEPGDTWQPTWTVNQPAATLWYHPHPHQRTGIQCYRGLAGVLIVDDDVTDSLEIPQDYGVDDIPVVIMDARFTEDGQFDTEFDPDLGLMGDTPVVNGITNAHFDATTRRVRLRLIEGATMRFYNIGFDDGRSFQVISTDSGLLPKPVEVDYVLMSPGERVDIVVDLTPGETVTLVSAPLADNFGLAPAAEDGPDFGFQHSFDLLTIHGPADDAPQVAPLHSHLDPAAAGEPDMAGAVERSFALNTFTINGQTMDMERVDFAVDHDGPELWTVTNENTDWPHNFHVHNARFKVLELTGSAVAGVATYGWKDTVALPPKATVRLAVELGHYPDPTVAYMYHCHMLWHEDNGMMGQYVMVEPGQQPDLKPMTGTQEFHHHA